MGVKKEFVDYKLNVDIMILNTCLFDEEFRKRHNCNCSDKVISDGLSFCNKMIKARARNKELMKEWTICRLSSPLRKNFFK